MGSQVLIGVLFLILLFSIISSSLNSKQDYAADKVYGYVKYSAARDIARTALNLSLKNRELYGPTGFVISGNLDKGSYAVASTQINDTTFRLVSTAKFEDTTYTVRTTLQAYPKPFPTIGAAFSVHVDSIGAFDLNKGKGSTNQLYIDGWDYDSLGLAKVGGGIPGIGVMNSYDSSLAAVGRDSNHIDGTKDIAVSTNLPDPSTFIDQYIQAADYVYTSGQKNYHPNLPDSLGTPTNPKITYISSTGSGNIDVNGNTYGYGVMILRGDVKISGTFHFYGLLLIYDNSTITFNDLGNATIAGAVVAGGANGSNFSLNGTPSIRYSSRALQKARLVGKLLAYRIIDWYE